LVGTAYVFNPSLCAALGYDGFPHFADAVLYVEFECEAICGHHPLRVPTPSFAPWPTRTQTVNITKSPTPSYAPSRTPAQGLSPTQYPTPTQSRADAWKGNKINGWQIAVICLSLIVFCVLVEVSVFVIKSRRQRAADNILSTAFEIDETLDPSTSVTTQQNSDAWMDILI
jgi:hypothetical protein